MDIRPATTDDVLAVLPMVRKIAAMHEQLDPAKYGYRGDPAELYHGWLASRASDAQSVFLVAETDDGKVVAFLVGTVEREIPIYRLRKFGFIHDVWVEEDYRNEGIGRQLVTSAVERFRELGAAQVRCDTVWDNATARDLFKACGFRPSVVEMLIEL
jgi:ribosomal protein S18 acetylase RimI-like enzyme